MLIQIYATARLALNAATPSLLLVEARDVPGFQQVIDSDLQIDPCASTRPFIDLYGNPTRTLLLPSGENVITYRARVEVAIPVVVEDAEYDANVLDLPPDTLHYLLPSRYCPSDRFESLAHDLFGRAPAGIGRVRAICNWITWQVRYEYGHSTTATTAADTVIDRIGVCRDFAHLAITFCRALGIPARYCSGYCVELDPPDFHAYFQAFVGNRWVVFDATVSEPRKGLVLIATGRDAADCAWSTLYGSGETRELQVWVTLLDSATRLDRKHLGG